jgi:hypothetical protein
MSEEAILIETHDYYMECIEDYPGDPPTVEFRIVMGPYKCPDMAFKYRNTPRRDADGKITLIVRHLSFKDAFNTGFDKIVDYINEEDGQIK